MRAALLIVDMQVALVAGAHDERGVVARLGAIAERARAGHVPVIYVQHNHATFEPLMRGRPGWQVDPRIAPQAHDEVFEKTASDAFYRTDLAMRLGARRIDTLVIGGMMTEYCVDATARSALSHDFDVVLLRDCHTTGDSDLPAAQIVAHHNALLPNVAHPARRIRAVASTDLEF